MIGPGPIKGNTMSKVSQEVNLINTELYKSDTAFSLGEASQVMHMPAQRALAVLTVLCKAKRLTHIPGKGDSLGYWKRRNGINLLSMHWRTDYSIPMECTPKYC